MIFFCLLCSFVCLFLFVLFFHLSSLIFFQALKNYTFENLFQIIMISLFNFIKTKDCGHFVLFGQIYFPNTHDTCMSNLSLKCAYTCYKYVF